MPFEPDFQDPPKAPNYFPYIANTAPPALTSVFTPNTSLTFTVSVGDKNLGDTLYVRWVLDYPPYSQALSKVQGDMTGTGVPVPPPSPLAELRPDQTFTAKCTSFAPAMSGMRHTLAFIVSDRLFRQADQSSFAGENRYSQVANDANNQPVTIPVLTSWTIEGCQQ